MAIVPVRMLPLAKRRLAHVARHEPRTAIVWSLLEHVVGVLLDSGLRVIALAPHDVPQMPDVETWTDRAAGLNAALDDAIGRTGVPVLVVHADLPRITRDDVTSLLDSPGDVVIARARDGGTNALLMRKRIRSSFGPRSALAHAIRARSSGLRAYVIDRPGLALDVDDEASLTTSGALATESAARRRC